MWRAVWAPRRRHRMPRSREDPDRSGADPGYQSATQQFQRELISRALDEAQGNLGRAATQLALTRHALRHQMLKLGSDQPGRRRTRFGEATRLTLRSRHKAPAIAPPGTPSDHEWVPRVVQRAPHADAPRRPGQPPKCLI